MVTPTISPAEAENAGCSASADFLRREEANVGTPSYYYYDFYRLTATAVDGWRFKEFVIWHQGFTGANPFSTSSNPFNAYEATHPSSPELNAYYTEVQAVFEKVEPPPATKFTVTTGMTPNAARGSTSGDGEYEEGTECTVSCTAKCSLWIFDRWEFSTGETYNTQSVTFTVTADVTCTAVFRHENTGQLIYDADGSGSLICVAGGDLLYNGDSVDP